MKKPTLTTAAKLIRRIENQSAYLLWTEELHRRAEILESLSDPTLHISAHQAIADEWATILRSHGAHTPRWIVYREDVRDAFSSVGAVDQGDWALQVTDSEFSVLMIALERALLSTEYMTRNPRHNEIHRAIGDLFKRLLGLPHRPAASLDPGFDGRGRTV